MVFFSPKYAGSGDPSPFCDLVKTVEATAVDFVEKMDESATIESMSAAEVEEGGKVYDFVVCGGGTAGCVLASRLTEDPSVSVLLIEAGESDQKQLFSKIPAGWGNLCKSVADWDFLTTPQTELNNRELYIPRGKMLGGCSGMNAQIYQRCSPEDYNQWEALGATGWSHKDLEPYFQKEAAEETPDPAHKVETLEEKTQWCKSFPPTVSELSTAFLETGPSVGVPKNPTLNRDTNTSGITRFEAHVDSKGQRSSTSAAYLPPDVFSTRENLTVLVGTTCSKLVLSPNTDSDGKRCVVAVEVAQSPSGPRYLARARKEVIVSQGTYGTPQLLLCSGIGRKSTLDVAGVKQELKLDGVGETLRDHVMFPVVFEAMAGTSCEWMKSPIKTLPSLVRWLITGGGPLATNLAEAGAFLRSDDIQQDGSVVLGSGDGKRNASGPTSADLEIVSAPLYLANHALNPPPSACKSNDFLSVGAIVLKPHSTGTVTIRSGDAFEKPVIDTSFFTDSRDKQVMLDGIRLVRRLSLTSPLKDYLLGVASGPNGQIMSLDEWENASEERLWEMVKEYAEVIYHPVGTCHVGPLSSNCVVDPTLLVYGTSNLRICDASVFPESVSGHPVAAVVAVAEKFAVMLKEQYSG